MSIILQRINRKNGPKKRKLQTKKIHEEGSWISERIRGKGFGGKVRSLPFPKW